MALVLGCTAGLVMTSGWYQGYVEIDGYDEDWAGLWGFPDESSVAFAVKNHDETLYLAFSTHDQKVIRQAAFGGFAIILDSKGGNTGRYGLRFEASDPEIIDPHKMAASKLKPLLAAHMHQTLNGRIPIKISDGRGNIQPFKYRGAVFSSFDGDTWFLEASLPMAAMKHHPKKGGKIGVGFLTLAKYTSLASWSSVYADYGYYGLASGPWWAEVQLARNPDGQ